MSKTYLVIGMGQFGLSVAQGLAGQGGEVTAIDASEERIRMVAAEVEQAFTLDATDERSLQELRVDTYNAVIIGIGEKFFESSILCATLLRQLGAARIIARATSDLNARILLALGVDRVVQPEILMGAQLALEVSSPGLIGQLDLGEGARAVEVEIPEQWVDKSLAELDLRRRVGVTVVALRRRIGESRSVLMPSPRPDQPLVRGEALLVLGQDNEVKAFLKELS